MFASKAGHLFLGWSKLCYESEVAELLFPGMICLRSEMGKKLNKTTMTFASHKYAISFQTYEHIQGQAVEVAHHQRPLPSGRSNRIPCVGQPGFNLCLIFHWGSADGAKTNQNIPERINWWCKDKPKLSANLASSEIHRLDWECRPEKGPFSRKCISSKSSKLKLEQKPDISKTINGINRK